MQQTKPTFREVGPNEVKISDGFDFAYESRRTGGVVEHSGTVVKTKGNRFIVDVGKRDYYVIFETGRVQSISGNEKRQMVGWMVYA